MPGPGVSDLRLAANRALLGAEFNKACVSEGRVLHRKWLQFESKCRWQMRMAPVDLQFACANFMHLQLVIHVFNMHYQQCFTMLFMWFTTLCNDHELPQ